MLPGVSACGLNPGLVLAACQAAKRSRDFLTGPFSLTLSIPSGQKDRASEFWRADGVSVVHFSRQVGSGQ